MSQLFLLITKFFRSIFNSFIYFLVSILNSLLKLIESIYNSTLNHFHLKAKKSDFAYIRHMEKTDFLKSITIVPLLITTWIWLMIWVLIHFDFVGFISILILQILLFIL